MTVQECADLLNCNARVIRESIDNKTFPFGISFMSSAGQKIYKISKIAFDRWYYGKDI